MWCTHCRQDVPGIFSVETGRYRCPRCAESFAPAAPPSSPATAPSPVRCDGGEAAELHGPHVPSFDDWECDEQLRHVERLLTSRSKAGYERHLRVDGSHASSAAPVPTWQRWEEQRRQGRRPRGLSLVWPLLTAGMMAFVCGGTLVGWSLWTGRTELWNVGLPIALLGQLALLGGLVLQLERMWAASRETASKLEHVDDELQDLKSTTSLLSSQEGAGSHAFYAHLAGGANPQLLLADLKSQLDLLAVKLSRGEGN